MQFLCFPSGSVPSPMAALRFSAGNTKSVWLDWSASTLRRRPGHPLPAEETAAKVPGASTESYGCGIARAKGDSAREEFGNHDGIQWLL